MNFGTQVDLKNGMIISIVTKYSDLPSATLVPGQYYRTLQGENASWRPTWLGGTYYPEGIYYSDGSSWDYVGEFPYQATQAEVDSGSNNNNFVTPKTFTDASKWNTKFNNPTGLATDYLDGQGIPKPFPVVTIADGDYGDVTVSGGGTIITIDNLAVTDSKVDSVSASKIIQDTLNRLVTDTEKSIWNGKQNALGYTPENIANKGIALGYAPLDVSSKVPATNSRTSNVTYNTVTGELNFTWADGSTQTVDLPIENLLQSASYNSLTQTLTVTTNGGVTIDISLADLVDLPEIVLSTSSNPSATPTTGQKLFVRQDNGALWTNLGGAWVGGYIGVTSTDASTWNNKYDSSNPNGYETPTQLNTRDLNNRSRSNHTGTQSASTISDFDIYTRGTLLTGLGTLVSASILATDTILEAFRKTQGQINNKQDALSSGVNIKTIGGVSLLGSGDITIPSSGITFQETMRLKNIF